MQNQLGEDPNKIGEARLWLVVTAETALRGFHAMELLASDTVLVVVFGAFEIPVFSCIRRQGQYLLCL